MSTDTMFDLFDDEAASPPLDFEAWATLAARLLVRKPGERAAILRSAELDDEGWQRCDAHYEALLVADLRRGNFSRASIYGSKCSEEMARSAETSAAPPREKEPSVELAAPAAIALEPAAPAFLGSPALETPAPALLDGGDTAPIAAPPIAPPLLRRRPPATVALPAMNGPPAAEPTLPFREGVAGLPPPAAPLLPRADLGDTPALVDAGTDAPLPFAQADTRVTLTLEQYASFRAELGVHPELRVEILAKYGISGERERRDLDELWRKCFVADRAAQQQFIHLSTQYRDWLVARKGR